MEWGRRHKPQGPNEPTYFSVLKYATRHPFALRLLYKFSYSIRTPDTTNDFAVVLKINLNRCFNFMRSCGVYGLSSAEDLFGLGAGGPWSMQTKEHGGTPPFIAVTNQP